MDEVKDKDGSVSEDVESATVTVIKPVVDSVDSEKPSKVVSAVNDVEVRDQDQGQIEESSSERVVVGEDRSCNGVESDTHAGVNDSGNGGGVSSRDELACTQGGLDLGPESGASRDSESKEDAKVMDDGARTTEVNAGGGGDGVDDGKLEVGVVTVEAEQLAMGTGVVASSPAEESSSGKTHVIEVEVAVVTRQEDLEGGLVEEGVERGGIKNMEYVSTTNVGALEKPESGAKGTSVAAGDIEVDEHKPELIENAIKGDKGTDSMGSDAHQNFETEKDGVFSNKVSNPEIQTTVGILSTIVDTSSVETQVVKDDAATTANNEGVNPELGVSGIVALKETTAAHALEGTISISNSGSILTEKDGIANAYSRSADKEPQVALERKVSSVDNEEFSCPNIEDSPTLHQQNQVNQGMVDDSAQVDSKVELEMGVDKQVTGAEQTGLEKIQEQTVARQQGEVASINGSTEDHSNLCSGLKTSAQSTQEVVGDEVAEVDHLDVDVTISSSGNNQHPNAEMACRGMGADNDSASTDREKYSTSDAGVPEVLENDKQLMLQECLEKTAACDAAMVSSNDVQGVEVLEKKLDEKNSEARAGYVGTEIDLQVVDGGESCRANYEEATKSKTELKEPAEGDLEAAEGSDEAVASDPSQVEEHVSDEEPEEQELEVEEQDADTDQSTMEEEFAKQSVAKSGHSVKAHQASYELPSNNEGEFSVSDLVWGKVRSHPWWPGQIFDSSDASEKAMKYHKKDCFLVAYFGDRTFAWNEAALLKPFRSHFFQIEKQSSLEAFQNAVDCALEEVSRRVELGLACLCTPKDVYEKIKCQVVDNTGIREECSTRDGVDRSTSADLFEPEKLVEYMKALARSPTGGADRLELVIAKSQLLAFYRLKGYTQLPELQFCGGSESMDSLEFKDEENEHASSVRMEERQILSGQEILQTQRSYYHKRKHNLKDGGYPSKKERSLSDLMAESWDSVDEEIGSDGKASSKSVASPSGRKRKGSDFCSDDSATPDGRKTISFAKVSAVAPSLPKPSFKIGECIRRVASQMAGPSSILKPNNQKLDGSSDGFVADGYDLSFEHSEDADTKKAGVSTLDELLSQLHLAAEDPLKGYSFFGIIISFFSDFRNSVIIEQDDKVSGKRRKPSHLIGGSPETFEFEDMSDTYWTDRVIQNGTEEQPTRKSRKRDNQLVPVDSDKSVRRSNSRKRYSDGSYDLSAEKPVGYVDEKAPAELVMHFPVVDSVPSETHLNKMFRRFGPIKESETEVDRDTNRARVVFKKCSDAEAAYGSAAKFNIFGTMLVNYQLNYTITVPFKTVPITPTHGVDDATLFLEY